MKRMVPISMLVVLLITMLAVPTLSQGLHWEGKTIKGDGGKERLDHFYYMPGMMKMVAGDNGQAVILRLDKEVMIMIEPEKKQYTQMTFEEMERLMAAAGAMQDAQMEAMRQQLEQLPPEQRKMAEEMMGSGMKPQEPVVSVEKTGETKTISGYSCTKYIVTEDGERNSTVWATKDIGAFEVMKEDMVEFANRMEAVMQKGGVKRTTGMMDGIDGFPIETEMKGGWKSVVTRVEEKSTPESEFEPPAGYEETDFPGMGEVPPGY